MTRRSWQKEKGKSRDEDILKLSTGGMENRQMMFPGDAGGRALACGTHGACVNLERVRWSV